MRIYTSSFNKCQSSKGVSIDKNGGIPFNFKGPHIDELTPTLTWDEDFTKKDILSYIVYYYERVLKNFNIGNIFRYIKDGTIFLTFSDEEEFSHRHILAVYLELLYGLSVREITYLNDELVIRPRNKYYATIRETLEKLLKADIDMKNFTSIAAAHAYSIAESLNEDGDLNRKYGITKNDIETLAESLEHSKKI